MLTSSDERGEPSPILVFQMAKVASRSWARLLEQTFPGRQITHFHFASPKRLDGIAALRAEDGPSQTMVFHSLRDFGRYGPELSELLQSGRWIGPKADVVTGVRDPVARAVSAVAFIANRHGYTRLPVTVRDGGTAENLCRLFHEVAGAARTPPRDGDTLLSVLAHVVADYRTWFEDELAPAFGVDVTSVPFNHAERHLTIDRHNRVFLYRVEDLSDPVAGPLVQRAASNFLGTELGPVPPDDTSGERRYQSLYREFVRQVRLTEEELDWFYHHPQVTHFYTPAEIATFRRRWSRS